MKELLGIVSVILSLLAYLFYFRNIFRGWTKPHAFSWLVWATMTAIGFAAQWVSGAGAGAWVTGFSSLACGLVFLLALKRGEKNIVLLDWLGLAGAGVALSLWYLTKDPLLSVILVVTIDAGGFLPTFRKSFHQPYQETLLSYFLNGLKFVPALWALESFTLTTALYPSYLVLSNWGFVLFAFLRRRQLASL